MGEQPINILEESVSMMERTSMKLYPIVKEVLKRLINETQSEPRKAEVSKDSEEVEKFLLRDESISALLEGGGCAADMRSVLGFLN